MLIRECAACDRARELFEDSYKKISEMFFAAQNRAQKIKTP
jgi:hypothetical protein